MKMMMLTTNTATMAMNFKIIIMIELFNSYRRHYHLHHDYHDHHDHDHHHHPHHHHHHHDHYATCLLLPDAFAPMHTLQEDYEDLAEVDG